MNNTTICLAIDLTQLAYNSHLCCHIACTDISDSAQVGEETACRNIESRLKKYVLDNDTKLLTSEVGGFKGHKINTIDNT